MQPLCKTTNKKKEKIMLNSLIAFYTSITCTGWPINIAYITPWGKRYKVSDCCDWIVILEKLDSWYLFPVKTFPSSAIAA